MRHLDLFSGIGGFALAARWLGIQTTQFVELDPYCQKVLSKNFPGVPIHDDIRTYTAKPGDFDLVTGGFPCQDNSRANTNGKGLEGERSGLWFEMRRVIEESQAKFVVVENVRPSKNRRWDLTVKRNLEELGYKTLLLPISSASVGANHLRERLFVVAYSTSLRLTSSALFNALARQVFPQKEPSWWERSGKLVRGNSGRIFLLPGSWSCGVDDGPSRRLDCTRLARIHALGNAVVPQVARIPLLRVLELAAVADPLSQ